MAKCKMKFWKWNSKEPVGGAVTCMMLGDRTVKSFAIDPDLLNPEEADMLSDLLAAACNEAPVN